MMPDDDDDRLSIDESRPDAPLLGVNADPDPGPDPDQDSSGAGSGHGLGLGFEPRGPLRPWHIARTPRAISTVVCLAVFLWVLSGMLAMVPGAQLAEEIFCQRYHDDHDRGHGGEKNEQGRAPAPDCKADGVQSSLAWLFGLVLALDTAVALVVTLPFGALADRARGPAYLLAAGGQLANVAWSLLALRRALPLELLVLGPAFGLLGGGLTVAFVVLYAVVSDVTTPENRAMTYFCTSLAANLAVFVGPPLASAMIRVWSPWVPLLLCLVATVLAGGVMLVVPETARGGKRSSGTGDGDGFGASKQDQAWHEAVRGRFADIFCSPDLRSALGRRSVALLLVAFLLAAPLPSAVGTLFLQYYGKRFGKSMEDGGYMLAIRGGLAIVVVGALLPAVSRWLGSSPCVKLSPFRRDLVLAQASAAFAGLGYFLLGGPSMGFLVSGVVILTLSIGIGPLCRSLISTLVRPDQTSRVFAVTSIIEGIGSLPAGPFLAWMFSSGMRLGGIWLGLPFFFLGSLGFLLLVVFCLVGAGHSTADFHDVASDDPVRSNVSTDAQLDDVL